MEEVEKLRDTFRRGTTRSAKWRKGQLTSLLKLLTQNEIEICKALQQDLGKHHIEAYRDEVGLLVKSIKHALKNLNQWMAPVKAGVPLVAFPTSAALVPEPLGNVLIFSSWNYPFGLSLEPLVGALAAGNTAVVKPSETSPASSSLLAKLIPMYLDNKAIIVVEGGVVVCEQLLQRKWDLIFFTGNPKIGRLVMTAAAKHLTPVVLELGGKSPAVVDTLSSYRDRKVASARMVSAKWGSCNGQACAAVDYVLIDEKFASTWIVTLKSTLKTFYGDDPKQSNAISRIVNKHHYLRLKSLLADPRVSNSVVHGGGVDDDNMYIEPTILLDPPLDSEIMTEEIFGPLLPIITLKRIEESIEFINSRPKPLCLYVFTSRSALADKIVVETSSGSVTVNDATVQYAVDSLPFGGVGQSGFGRYHGKFSFDTFSHTKPILCRGFMFEVYSRYPPWNGSKLNFIKSVYAFNYWKLVLHLLGFGSSATT
ncbi:aldehyde dehydrogenase family 3 member F1 isoform X1 [Amborella trichopoda]|uniref:Aldehyde dehydrogenase n=1 Tax=Amborella trichopoda TaxID=13333 RepID=W1NMQ2_AMBTC|nr:aldehyde dehydrogenase family 3 member F1 isoform X1 [Amborella trichopoda]ERM96569.1 hypothetical protein AMTR_s00001p00269720 [Amborella trichopoda]|eukprot:XP_006829153.1 aldehyde dehydrogenase family 3 member F1 isoform X1 [Amborella trichopoda]